MHDRPGEKKDGSHIYLVTNVEQKGTRSSPGLLTRACPGSTEKKGRKRSPGDLPSCSGEREIESRTTKKQHFLVIDRMATIKRKAIPFCWRYIVSAFSKSSGSLKDGRGRRWSFRPALPRVPLPLPMRRKGRRGACPGFPARGHSRMCCLQRSFGPPRR